MNPSVLETRSPTVAEYNYLRAAVGWPIIGARRCQASLESSLFSVCAHVDGCVAGMGRVVGDGGIYFYVQDVIVAPQWQKRGIGKQIMDAIMQYLSSHAAERSFVGLMAARGASGFYERYGFVARPADAPGMVLRG